MFEAIQGIVVPIFGPTREEKESSQYERPYRAPGGPCGAADEPE
jgi:hypothetical protein